MYGWVYDTPAELSYVGFYQGPGGWIYYTDRSKLFAVWSPKTRRAINVALTGDTARRVIEELQGSGGTYLGTDRARAFAKAGVSASASTSAATSSASGGATLPITGGLTVPDVSLLTGGAPTPSVTPGVTAQPWFWPAVVGGGLLLLIAVARPARGAPAKAAPAGRFKV